MMSHDGKVRFQPGNQYVEQIKRSTGITDDVALIDNAMAVWWLLLSESIDNIATIVREDGTTARFGLTPQADEFLRTKIK